MLPSLLLQCAQATKEALGPAAMSVSLSKEAQAKAQENVNSAGDNIYNKSMAEVRLTRLEKEGREAGTRFQTAQDHLAKVRENVAEKVGLQLVTDAQRYLTAMDKSIAAEREKYLELIKTAAQIANGTAPVEAGEIVEVVVAGSLTRARVEEVPPPTAGAAAGDAVVRVSPWKVVGIVNQKYEEGYDTRQKEILSLPRRDVYGKGGKISQTITEATLARISNAAQGDPAAIRKLMEDPSTLEFLLALYADARVARTEMVPLGQEVVSAVGEDVVTAIVPACKGVGRASVKATEKYSGKFALLTDLSRMTFDCATITAALGVLRHLGAHKKWTIARVKDRLMLAYDASPTGGYRDMLLNAVHVDTGHIVEVQITLRPLLEIKTSGGHAVYKLARLLELNAAETTEFSGEADETTVQQIGKGLIRDVRLSGVAISSAVREGLLSKRGLLSPACAVVKLVVQDTTLQGGGAIFEGWSMDRAVPRLMVEGLRGSNLKYLAIQNVGLVGEIPVWLLELCVNLEVLGFSCNKRLVGRLPPQLGLLRRLKRLYLYGCSFTGAIPAELGDLENLQVLQLSENQLSGAIPAALGRLQNLQKLGLHENQLETPKGAPLSAKGNMAYSDAEATANFLRCLRQ